MFTGVLNRTGVIATYLSMLERSCNYFLETGLFTERGSVSRSTSEWKKCHNLF